MTDTVLNHARIVDPATLKEHLGAVLIRDGKIAEVAGKPYPAGEFDSGVIDLKGA
ncbi:MAG: dihydroorotase, partial [Methylobacterium sp.]|nr:dihydroorotase [Methylobacterium sp.]